MYRWINIVAIAGFFGGLGYFLFGMMQFERRAWSVRKTGLMPRVEHTSAVFLSGLPKELQAPQRHALIGLGIGLGVPIACGIAIHVFGSS